MSKQAKTIKATGTNIFSMSRWVLDGCPARVESVSIRHLKRCIAAGLIDVSTMSVTAAGVEAIRANAWHPTSAKALELLEA